MRMMENAGCGMGKRIGRRKAVCALALAAVMTLSLAGCGESYDPTGLVKANLEYLSTGKAAEDTSEETEQTAEKLKLLYEAELNGAIDEVMMRAKVELPKESEEEIRLLVGTFIVDALEKSRYEVKEDFTEKEGIYYVDVDVYPMELMDDIRAWIEGEEYLDDWKNMLSSGEYVYTTDEQLMEDIYRYMYEKASAFVEATGYLEPVTMTVRVEESNGTYQPNQEDLAAAGAAAMGEQL